MPKLFFRFLKYYLRAKTRYNVHSPFVFEFTEAVLEDDRWFYAFDEIEAVRDYMLKDKRTIRVKDMGAGSKVENKKERSIASLARHSANQPLPCQYLFKIVNLYKPETMLELGTSLGISTNYQAAAARNSKMITIEGCPQTAHLATGNFKMMKTKNVKLLQGSFDDLLPKALKDLGRLDYLFVDGNHRKEPTLRYFEKCLEHAHPGSVFVFDDIHWSAGMEAAWEEIKQNPKVTLTIDLFFFGVVFFRKEQQRKEHFILAPWMWKPWRIGLVDFFG
ncbi:MAG TPA: class I SAM-dependent methyltransferase [Bacteroidetes bacterium]|nr:class I SAM-dependent methyltransferase [Bacteroidota bacterium]